jgi:hypothetical protein
MVNKIKLKKPDVIFAAVVGGSNVAWFKQLNAAGVTAKTQTLLTISVTEDEVLGIGGENLTGFFSSMKYFQSLDNPNNKSFVEAFKKMWGDKSVIGDVTVTAVATQALSRFDLDFAGTAVGAVAVNGTEAKFRRSGEELVITPAESLPKGKRFTVTVTGFTATPILANSGAPAGWVRTVDGTVLAGQPDSAHRLFPSNDHPRDPATYTITLTTPDGSTIMQRASWQLLSSTEQLSGLMLQPSPDLNSWVIAP